MSFDVKKVLNPSILAACAAALLTAACASAGAPPSTIDINNTTVEHTSPIQLGDAQSSVAPGATNAEALDTATSARLNGRLASGEYAFTPMSRPTLRRSNDSLFGGGGGGGGIHSGFAVFVDQTRFHANSNSTLAGTTSTGGIGADFRNATGYGAAFNMAIGQMLSLEIGASWVKPKVNFTPTIGNFGTVNGDTVRMVPITGTLQLHFLPTGTIDPYVGAGAAYVTFSNSGNFNTTNGSGLQNVKFDNEVGGLINGGVNIGFSHSLGLMLDAKYMWLHAKGTTTFTGGLPGNVGGGGSFNLNPFVVAAGLRFGF